jgi:hypothetical protein
MTSLWVIKLGPRTESAAWTAHMVKKLDLALTRTNWQAGFEGARPALRGDSSVM